MRKYLSKKHMDFILAIVGILSIVFILVNYYPKSAKAETIQEEKIAYLTEEEFCELMGDEINHSYLFKALVSLKFLYSSGVFDWDDKVRFVTPMNSILKKAPKRMTQFLLDKDTYLVCSQGKKPVYIIFSLKESKVFRVNENFFRLSELAARGYDVKEVIEIMGNMRMNSEKDIEEAFKETVSLLKKHKMME